MLCVQDQKILSRMLAKQEREEELGRLSDSCRRLWAEPRAEGEEYWKYTAGRGRTGSGSNQVALGLTL